VTTKLATMTKANYYAIQHTLLVENLLLLMKLITKSQSDQIILGSKLHKKQTLMKTLTTLLMIWI